MSVNETRLCVKLALYSKEYNIFIYKYGEIVLACGPFPQVTSARQAHILLYHLKIGYRDVYITTEYTEQIGDSLSGVTRVVTLVKLLNGKFYKTFIPYKCLLPFSFYQLYLNL